MTQYVAFEKGVEVNGETVLAVIDGMESFKVQALQVLKDCGIDNPAPGKWYSQQLWLNAFKKIEETFGKNTLFTIGEKIPSNAKFPPGVHSLGTALSSIDVAYHLNHRFGEIGHYKLIRTSQRSAKMICHNPYPCDFDKGIISAMAKRFKPKGCQYYAFVKHDEVEGCRKLGGESCTYVITW